MLPKRIILTIAVLVISITSYSKTVSYKHFSVEDGLPSSEVYDAIQDNDGFMWFATDRGVTRFDGYEFETFTTEDGLPDNVVFQLFKDRLGRIWFVSFSGALSYIENNEIKIYRYNNILKREINTSMITSFYIDDLMTVHIGYRYEGYISLDNNGTFFRDTTDLRPNTVVDFGPELLNYAYRPANNIYKNPKSLLLIENLDTTNFNLPNINSYEFQIQEIFKDKNDGTIYFSIGKRLYKIFNNKITLEFIADNSIIKITQIDNLIWLGIYQSGYKTLKDNKVTFEDLPNLSITDFFVDNQNSIWITTLENGIYFLANSKQYSLTTKDGLSSNNIFKVTGNSIHIVASDKKGELNFIPKVSNHSPITTLKNNTFLKPIPNPFNDFFYFHGNSSGKIINKKLYPIKSEKDILHAFSSDTVLMRTPLPSLELCKADGTSIQTYLSGRIVLSLSIRTYFFASKDHLLIGSLDGVYELTKNNDSKKFDLNYWGKNNALFTSRVTQIEEYENFDFIVATRGEGLLFVKNKTPIAIKKNNGLISNQITSLFVDSSQNIWVGSSQGLSIIDFKSGITNLKMEDGLISNEITDIYVSGDNAYIATKKGLTILDKKFITQKRSAPPVILKSIYIENNFKIAQKNNSIILKYKAPLLEIKFAGINYKSIDRIKYRYRLNPHESWQYTKNNQLTFTNLASGEYNLEIQASNDNKNWSTEPARLHILVAYPFWRTNWFIILSAFGLSFILFGIYRFALTRIKKREEIKRQVQNLRFEALNAQMNPHFIFNSLNSVQHFIMTNDKRESTRYLSKFAKLMRKTLDHSREKNVSLHEELEALELYLELEALRFDNLITYQIEVDKKINTSRVILPALLIQPIVENAILHGIRPNANGGHISISILSENSMLYISIIDNGIGREAALLNKGKGHNSKGGILTKERVSLFAKEYNSDATYEIIDLMEDDKSLGTEVRIKLPLILKANK